jgi:transcriptional regulator with XRE-family HTH domain
VSAEQRAGQEPGAWPWPAPPGPGDLGRRISYRRQELQLTVPQLAERAGMSAQYLEYVELYPSQLTSAALNQIAAALGTSTAELLGGEAGQPPGRGGPASRPVLEELTVAECLRLLEPGGIGRVGFSTPDGPVMLPVNFTMSAGTVIFRTAGSGFLAGHADGGEAGFEVDRLDEAMREGWSVLVLGPAEQVADPAEVTSLREHAAVWPWAGGEREVYVRIAPGRISGRRIRAT